MSQDGPVVRRLAAMIGHGATGLALAREFARAGARTRSDLKAERFLSRLPREARANVLYNPAKNTLLATARRVAGEVVRRLAFDSGAAALVIPVGSVRRGARRVKDLDFLVVVPDGAPPPGRARLRPSPGSEVEIADVYASGARRQSLILHTPRRNYRADLFFAFESEKPFALFHFTGPRMYNIRTRALAKRRGWLLNQYGIFDAAASPRRRARGASEIRTERDLARFLGVTYRRPADRPTG